MGQLSVSDPLFPTKILAARSPVELIDDRGQILGTYAPSVTFEDFEAAGLWLSDEEFADATRPDRRTYTTAEVITHLRSLG